MNKRGAGAVQIADELKATHFMHRAPLPTPDNEPTEDDDPVPEPGNPTPDDQPVPDHNPSLYPFSGA